MSSLTPAHRNQEATDAAFHEGAVNGLLTLLPTCGGLYLAMKNSKNFVARTNWQSRTAIAIMPALFVFAFTAERQMEHKMKEIARETQHSTETVQWAEEQLDTKIKVHRPNMTDADTEAHLMELYQQSVQDSGICVVPGDTLGLHHRAANWASANPLKVLAGMAVPSVAWIFYGNTGKEHLQFSVKLLHTRVFGQFATLSLLLSVMGFKEYMERNGKFVTQADVDARVEEMRLVRESLMARLQEEKQHRVDAQRELAAAHEEDVRAKKKKNPKPTATSSSNSRPGGDLAPAAAVATSPHA